MKHIFRTFSLIVLAAMLASCEKPIEGELEKLPVDINTAPDNPCWSGDGTKLYFIDLPQLHHVAEYDINSKSQKELTDQFIRSFDIYPSSNRLVAEDGKWLWIRDPATWETIDSLRPCQKAIEMSGGVITPKFSYESDKIIYYTFKILDSVFLHRVDIENHTDEELMITFGQQDIFSPGPGDSLFVLNDTIYNFASEKRIYTKIKPYWVQWNPVSANEILIASGKDSDLFLFDMETKKTRRITVPLFEGYVSTNAQFSPDGKKIAIVGCFYDGYYTGHKLWLMTLSN